MKETYIAACEVVTHKDRDGFLPVCCYGTLMMPGLHEIGGIFIKSTEPEFTEIGWEYEAECIERIYVCGSV